MSGDLLTGRDSELGAIRRALSGAGNYSGVVICGAAGVGKTRLAREVLARAQAAGERTNWITGTESARPLPLGAFTGSITETASESMPDVGRLINSFVAQQRRGRVLIGVDDAHLLDGLSAHVVHQLAQTRGPRLVVTVRTGEAEPDAVTALWKDGLLARLDLEPLSEAGTRSLIESTLEGAVDARSAQRFWKLTGGNALFLRQLVKDQVDAGRMQQVAGVWMWDDRIAVSQSITDMVGRQLGELSEGVALVVDTLSQCEPLAVDVLSKLAERADLEAAERMHLVTVERSGDDCVARLAHPLFGELRRASAGEMYLSRIRGKLAQGLSDKPDSDMQSTVRRAMLTLESDLPPDPDLFVDAARFAMTLLDLELADDSPTPLAAGASEAPGVQAMNLVLRGRGDDAEKFLREITTDGHEDTHRWSTVRAANLIWMLGRPDDASEILDGLAAGPETAGEQASREAVQACVDAVYGRCEPAAEKATAALDSHQLGDFHSMMASFALMMALGALGRADELTSVAERALERASTSFETAHLRFWFGGVYARACRLTGGIDECVKMAKQMADSVNEVPGLAYANLVFLLGQADLVRGELPGAVKLLHEALAGVEHHGITTGLRPATCFALTEAHAKLGQSTEADEALAEARQNVPDEYVYMHTALAVATGWAQASGGYLSDAVATVREAATLAHDRGQPTHELICLQAAAQWGDASGADRARELAGELSLPLADAVARHVESLAAKDGEGLLVASSAYRALGDRVTAADAAAQAAVALSQSQQRRRRLYAAAIAQGLSDECGGLSTPALRSPTGHPLTERQREIVELAVAGMSNKDIATRLIMSVRSVEGHLYRACQRVGANSREELAAIIRPFKGPAAD